MFNVHSLKVYAGVTAHSSGVNAGGTVHNSGPYAGVLLLTAQHTKVSVFYNVMECFPLQKV